MRKLNNGETIAIVILTILVIFLFFNGLVWLIETSPIAFVPEQDELDWIAKGVEEESPEEVENNCYQLENHMYYISDYFPKNITIDNNLTLTFDNLTKKEIFNLTKEVDEKTDGLIDMWALDEIQGLYLSYNTVEQFYIRCKWEELVEEIMSDKEQAFENCIKIYDDLEIKIRAHWPRNENHSIILCEV